MLHILILTCSFSLAAEGEKLLPAEISSQWVKQQTALSVSTLSKASMSSDIRTRLSNVAPTYRSRFYEVRDTLYKFDETWQKTKKVAFFNGNAQWSSYGKPGIWDVVCKQNGQCIGDASYPNGHYVEVDLFTGQRKPGGFDIKLQSGFRSVQWLGENQIVVPFSPSPSANQLAICVMDKKDNKCDVVFSGKNQESQYTHHTWTFGGSIYVHFNGDLQLLSGFKAKPLGPKSLVAFAGPTQFLVQPNEPYSINGGTIPQYAKLLFNTDAWIKENYVPTNLLSKPSESRPNIVEAFQSSRGWVVSRVNQQTGASEFGEYIGDSYKPLPIQVSKAILQSRTAKNDLLFYLEDAITTPTLMSLNERGITTQVLRPEGFSSKGLTIRQLFPSEPPYSFTFIENRAKGPTVIVSRNSNGQPSFDTYSEAWGVALLERGGSIAYSSLPLTRVDAYRGIVNALKAQGVTKIALYEANSCEQGAIAAEQIEEISMLICAGTKLTSTNRYSREALSTFIACKPGDCKTKGAATMLSELSVWKPMIYDESEHSEPFFPYAMLYLWDNML